MGLKLKNKRALVTGSTSGIGATIAKMLAAEGVKVIVHGRDATRAQTAVAEIRSDGGIAEISLGDLLTAIGVNALADEAFGAFGGIDIRVNNAGTSSVSYPSWFDIPLDRWTEMFNYNTLPLVRLAQALVSGMRNQKGDG